MVETTVTAILTLLAGGWPKAPQSKLESCAIWLVKKTMRRKTIGMTSISVLLMYIIALK